MREALVALLCGWLGVAAPVADPATDEQPADSAEQAAPTTAEARARMAAADVTGVIRLALERYVEPVDPATLSEGAKAGVAASLDPYCEYLPAQDAETMWTESTGKYCGIGVAVSEDIDGAVLVDYPEPDSPAFKAGIRMDDHLIEVDGKPLSELSFEDGIDLIGGAEGTEVEIVWLAAEDGTTHRAHIRRAALTVPTVQAVRRTDDGIAYLYLAEFEQRTPRELRRAIRALHPSTLRGLVLDLRDNPGGDVQAAVATASLFLPAGALVARTRGRIHDEDDHNYRSRGGEAWPGLRLALLVNDESASAAELFAAALRDHGRAPLVGVRTFGKALVQSLLPLDGEKEEGAILKLTTARYFTPSGALIHGQGIEPDIAAAQNDEEAFDVIRARMLAVRPDLASDEVRRRILSVPDAPLAAARAWILSDAPPPAARPEAPPRLPTPSRSPVRK